jgi:hypothetical protein
LEENFGGYRFNDKEHVLINAVTKTVFNVPTRCFSQSSYVNQTTNCPVDQDPQYVYARGLWMTPAQQGNSANWIYHNFGSTTWATLGAKPNPNRIAVNIAFPFLNNVAYPALTSCNDTARWEAVLAVAQRMQACNVGDCFVPGQNPNKVSIKLMVQNLFTEDFFAMDDLYGLNYLSRNRYANSIYSAGVATAVGFGLTGCSGAAPFQVVQEGGGRKGYATVPHLMAQEAANKQAVPLSTFLKLNHQMYTVRKLVNRYSLKFTNGLTVLAKKVILNMGVFNFQKHLQKEDNILFDLAGPNMKAMYAWTELTATKTFLHYDQAWWIKAGLTKGLVNTDETFKHMRFHQGHVVCANSSVDSCRGLFLASYQIAQIHEHKSIDWDKEGPHTSGPLYVARRTDARDAYILDLLHVRLMTIMSNLVPNTASIPPPTFGIFANWVEDPWNRCGCHQGVHSIPPGQQELSAIRPLPNEDIFIAQLDWMNSFGGFAEGPLIMAERVVHRFFNLAKPTWLPDPWYHYVIGTMNM